MYSNSNFEYFVNIELVSRYVNYILFVDQNIEIMNISPELLSWKPEYNVNLSFIDDQHKKFLDMLNRLKGTIKNKTFKEDSPEIFYSLVHYADDYLIKEEIYFKDLDYPKLDSHIKKHKEFFSRIIQFQKEITGEKEESYSELYEYLETWFNNHILKFDKEAVDFLKANGLK